MEDKWVRQGSCNHCGWCCENLGVFLITFPLSASMDIEYNKIRGMVVEDGVMKIVVDMHSSCQHHKDDRCDIYESRPVTCFSFPSEPNQIIGTPCSYYFSDENGKNVGGLSSPYPTKRADML